MLIIFVDALPHEVAKSFDSLSRFSTTGIRPGYGYSVNLHAELFGGVTPDEVGYFGDMAYTDRVVPLSWLERKLAALEFKWIKAARVIRLFLNVITRRRVGYIPLAFKGKFAKRGIYPLVQQAEYRTIFDESAFSFHIADRVKAGIGKKDAPVYESAKRAIIKGERDIMISLCDLDGIYHYYGDAHEVAITKLEWLDRAISELTSLYEERHPHDKIFIMSDHGISNADEHVTFHYEDFKEEIFNGDLVVFFDSLYFFYWTEDERVAAKVEEALEKLPGSLLTETQRAEAGVADRAFGDGIFLLAEGVGFCPNFFGFRPLKSYHGYDPKSPRSRGVLASNVNVSAVERNLDVYHLMRQFVD